MEKPEVVTALEKLTRGLGVFRPDLVAALNGELRALKHVWSIVLPDDDVEALLTARRAVGGNLELIIDQLEPRFAHQSLTPEKRAKQYRNVVSVQFNTPPREDKPEYRPLRSMALGQRREWLKNNTSSEHKIFVSPGQADLKDAIAKIATLVSSTGFEPMVPEIPVDNGTAFRPRQSKLLEHLVARHETEEKVIELLKPNQEGLYLPACIWGEPGTGKSLLAVQVAERIAGEDGHFITLHAGNPDLLQEELVEALIAERLEPATWSREFRRVAFKQSLSNPNKLPRIRCVILDGVEDEQLVQQLIPPHPVVPVLLTMRTMPRDIPCLALEISDFTEEQAYIFLQDLLPRADAGELGTLAQLLGYRPLALGHAANFVKQSTETLLSDLIGYMTESITGGLAVVEDDPDAKVRLLPFYELALSEIVQHHDACRVLDAFLAVAGRSGLESKEFVSAALPHSQNRRPKSLAFASGLRQLIAYGLIREVIAERVEETPEKTHRFSSRYLSMHSLTFEILRDMRLEEVVEVEERFLMGLSSGASAFIMRFENFDEASEFEPNVSISVMHPGGSGLPKGWRFMRRIDSLTWVVVHEETEQNIEHLLYVARYELHPNGTYVLDYRTLIRRRVTETEERLLARAEALYDAFEDRPNAKHERANGGSTDNQVEVVEGEWRPVEMFGGVAQVKDSTIIIPKA